MSTHTHTHPENNQALPMLLLSLAFLFLVGFQLQQIMIDRTALKKAYAAQVDGVKQSKELQERLDKLALGTQDLADKGNTNAVAIVAKLKESGVTINPKKDEAAAPAVTAPVPPAAPMAPAAP